MKFFIKRLASLFFVALALNAAWEFAHQSLYTVHGQAVPLSRLLQSILGDGLFTLLIYLIVAWIAKDWHWSQYPKRWQWGAVSVLGLSIAVGVEIHAVFYAHLWVYTPAMPTLFGLGLSPLLQMILLPGFSIWLTRNRCVTVASNDVTRF